MTASLSALEAVQGEARGPGEIAAPSIRFIVSITNSTAAPVDLSGAIVNVYYGAEAIPAIPLSEPGGSPLPAAADAGQSVQSAYVFSIPPEERGLVRIIIDYAVGVAPLVFEGIAPS